MCKVKLISNLNPVRMESLLEEMFNKGWRLLKFGREENIVDARTEKNCFWVLLIKKERMNGAE